jgi:hypothetical protein
VRACEEHRSGLGDAHRLKPEEANVEDLAKRLAELAVDEDDNALYWRIEASAMNIVVTAATSDLYPSEEAAWKGAGNLWRAILDLGYALADEAESEIGAIRRPPYLDRPEDKAWRGKVRMVLNPRA